MAENEGTPETPASPSVDASQLLLIVTGAHLRAEIADRPLAYRLRQRIYAWLEKHASSLNIPVLPVVCSDIWYLNHEELQRRPTISIGGPGVNALSAYYSQKLPTAYVRDNQVILQLDPEFTDLRVSIWGMNHDLTVDALDHFDRQFLDSYVRAVVTQVEPEE